jgi:hypothetical protein
MCLFDDLLIAIGKMVNSFSGAFNSGVNLGFRIIGDQTIQEDYVTYLDDEAYTDAGIQLSALIKKFFNFQVPDAVKDDY